MNYFTMNIAEKLWRVVGGRRGNGGVMVICLDVFFLLEFLGFFFWNFFVIGIFGISFFWHFWLFFGKFLGFYFFYFSSTFRLVLLSRWRGGGVGRAGRRWSK